MCHPRRILAVAVLLSLCLGVVSDSQVVCSQLASYLNKPVKGTITQPNLAQKFRVVAQTNITSFYAPITSAKGVTSAQVAYDLNGTVSTQPFIAALTATNSTGGFTLVVNSGAGAVFAPASYWLVLFTGDAGRWSYAAASTTDSESLMLQGLSSRATTALPWSVQANSSFLLSITGSSTLPVTPSSSVQPPTTPSPTGGVGMRVVNVKSSFDDAAAGVNLTATVLGDNHESSEVTIRATLEGLRVGDAPASLTDLGRRAAETADGVTTYIYSATAGESAMEQEFAFHEQAARGNFSGHTFDIVPGTFKWSIRLSSAPGQASPSSSSSAYTTMRYRLTSLLPASVSALDSNAKITRSSGVPAAHMTTYHIPLLSASSTTSSQPSSSIAVVKVEVFDIVLLIDDAQQQRFAPIEHSLTLSETSGEFVLELRFPPFTGSLSYDPSLGLGVLLGAKNDGTGGGGSNTGLAIAVGVAVPVAGVAVASVIGAAFAIGWRRRHLRKKDDLENARRAVNFSASGVGPIVNEV